MSGAGDENRTRDLSLGRTRLTTKLRLLQAQVYLIPATDNSFDARQKFTFTIKYRYAKK